MVPSFTYCFLFHSRTALKIPMIGIRKFTIFFILYVLCSIALLFTISFTTPAWLGYIFILMPLYCLGVLYLIDRSRKHPHEVIRFHRFSLYSSLILQGMIVLTCPVDCYGWHQGRACRSFLQVHYNNNLFAGMFFMFLLLYAISGLIYLRMIHVEGQQ
jgi:hypothetical protein